MAVIHLKGKCFVIKMFLSVEVGLEVSILCVPHSSQVAVRNAPFSRVS